MSNKEEKKEPQKSEKEISAKAKLEQKLVEAKVRAKRMIFSKELSKSDKKKKE
jgi:hypothetical protein